MVFFVGVVIDRSDHMVPALFMVCAIQGKALRPNGQKCVGFVVAEGILLKGL